MCVCLPAEYRVCAGHARRHSKDTHGVLGTSCLCSDCGLCQGQIHISSFDS